MKVLENRNLVDEERIQLLEKELEMTILFGEDADRKFETVWLKLLLSPLIILFLLYFLRPKYLLKRLLRNMSAKVKL